MNKKFLYICVICFLSFIKINASRKIICKSNQTIYFSPDELIFFESPNFPKRVTEDCEMDFVVENFRNDTNIRLMFVLTYGEFYWVTFFVNNTQCIGSYDIDNIFVINSSELRVKLSADFESQYTDLDRTAYQGYIVNDDWNVPCPLEAITGIDPFIFHDETEILYIPSVYHFFPGEMISRRCIWNFVAPKNYQFKIVLHNDLLPDAYFEVHSIEKSINFTLDNSMTDVPYHFQSSYIQIIFVPPKNSTNAFTTFIISITKKHVKKIDAGCKLSQDGKSFKWEIIDAYPNNAKCSLNLSLPYINQYEVYVDYLLNEKGIDTLKFSNDDGVVVIDWRYSVRFIFFLQANKNGYNNYALWEFESDGSVMDKGFSVYFTEIECKCNNDSVVIVPCTTDYEFGIMDNNDLSYCGNLECNFTFTIDPICPNKLILLTFNTGAVFEDEIIITANEKIIMKSEFNNERTYKIILHPENLNVLYFISVPSLEQRSFYIAATAINPPKNLTTITLTKSMPSSVLDVEEMPQNSIVRIELHKDLIDENDYLEIFSSFEREASEFFSFYENLNFDRFAFSYDVFNTSSKMSVAYISSTPYIYVYKIPVFTGQQIQVQYGILLFRAKIAHSINCLYEKNIFDGYNTAESEQNIAQISSPNGNCEIIILNRPVYILDNAGTILKETHSINHFWTTSKHENVQVFRGNLNGEKMLEFNFSSGDIWKCFVLASTWYTITVPINSSIYMELRKLPENILEIFQPGKMLWGTAYYGTKNIAPTSATAVGTLNIQENIIANIKILKFDVSRFGSFNFVHFYVSWNVTHAGQTFSFTNTTIDIQYQERGTGYTGVLFEIEALLS